MMYQISGKPMLKLVSISNVACRKIRTLYEQFQGWFRQGRYNPKSFPVKINTTVTIENVLFSIRFI